MAREKALPSSEAVANLRALAEKHVVTSEGKLRLLARRFGVQHSTADLKPALEGNVGKQILAPVPRYHGVSAATRPGSTIQADLADFRNAARGKAGAHHYFLLVSDVFTRQAFAEPLREKTSEITNAALKKIMPHVPGHGLEAAVSTDKGKEFSRIGSVLNPLNAVHREKQGKNDISVVDRTVQTIKVRLAEAMAN